MSCLAGRNPSASKQRTDSAARQGSCSEFFYRRRRGDPGVSDLADDLIFAVKLDAGVVFSLGLSELIALHARAADWLRRRKDG